MGRWCQRRQRWLGGLVVAAALGVGTLPTVTTAGALPVGAKSNKATSASGESPGGAATETEALQKAAETGRDVEVLSQRGESREVFGTPDGKLEAHEYLRPVWTRDDGSWKRIDTDLATTEGGAVAPKASTVDLRFSGGGDEAPLVRLERAGRMLSLSWPTALPKPQLSGPVATYPSVLPDVDLRMTAQEDGFSQLFVVKSEQAAQSAELAELRLKLAADGVNVEETADGGLAAIDHGAGGAVFEAPKPLMWDSSEGANGTAQTLRATSGAGKDADPTSDGRTREPGAAESGQLAPVDVDVTDDDVLVLTPDENVLRGESTKYPVFIDPQWYSPRASAWTMVSKYWASSPQWKFNGDSDSGMGYCGWAYCEPNDTKRLFYRIPVSTFAGKSILSAEFVVRNTWSASCSGREVQLWQTKDISNKTTWSTQTASGFWAKRLTTASFAYGYDGCSAKDAEFNVKSAVQTSANAHSSTMTFGLRASSESDKYAWKRFSDKAYLRVKYNRPPAQVKMSQLTMEYGGTCKSYNTPARIRSLGKIYASNVTDPDGDTVSVQFRAAWDGGSWNPARTSAKRSGSDFAISLPSSIPQNKEINWYVRAYDGAQYSPWSYAGSPTSCYFVYDTSVPKAPAITSDEYPASDPENPDDPWFDGVGKYGFFSLKGANSDVVKYHFGVNGDPTATHTLTTSAGATKQAKMLPARPGLNFVTAQAFDEAGNGSEIRTYQFRVKAGQPERSTWQLDEPGGASEAKAAVSGRTAELVGGPTPGVPGAKGTALLFDGVDDYARTDIPTVNTESGFSVAAWVRLSRLPDSAAIIAAQPGNHSPGFELYYSKEFDRWVFNQYKSDASGAGITRAMAASPGDAEAGTWTHLVGTLSATSHELKLYVNGELVGTTPYASPWDARRGLQIGAGSYDGKPGAFFPGTIDDLQIYDKPLTTDEVTRVHDKQFLKAGRPARVVFPLDETAEAKQVSGVPEVLSASYRGGAKTGVAGIAGKAAAFDGADGYATTGRPMLNTMRSFTISAWAKLPPTKPGHTAVIATQAGVHKSGFELYYSSTYDRWVFNEYTKDAPDSSLVRAMQPDGQTAPANTWSHLIGVRDTVADTLTLYVNGKLAGTAAAPPPWYAGGALQIGAASYESAPGSFFEGQIDDVRLFDRAVSAQEAQQLFQQRPLLNERWKLETADAGTASPSSPTDVPGGQPLSLNGGARIGPGWIDSGGLQLDGVDDYAATATAPVDTSSSFTVTAWAQAAAIPSTEASVLSEAGSHTSAFDVGFKPDSHDPDGLGRFSVTVRGASSATAEGVTVSNSSFYDVRDWNHLALVYDGFSKEARLYVNGVSQEVACADTDGDGNPDDTTCEDLISWADNVLAFKADGGMQVGRARVADSWKQYFPGVVDDVWAFQGALTDGQVGKLAGSYFDIPTEVPSR
ncbi:LamG-like jellyroll fold domain-containing protein [Streptomyces olivaceus]|uniref:LamG-like jellyroll fold domain-containing protein n=1 Tax=Streptomyces olivaceus TaxID=47716 RepID=UPI0036E4F982